MAKKSSKKKASSKTESKGRRASTAESTGTPAFPYTTTPGALRKFLQEVPSRPKPPKVNNELLKSWGIGDSNANSIIRVLKAVGLVTSSNDASDEYATFMSRDEGPQWLGRAIRQVYQPLFATNHAPHNEPNDRLTNLFNIHSGGAPRTIEYQIQSFKALCDFADFSVTADKQGGTLTNGESNSGGTGGGGGGGGAVNGPTVHIDLHIHLPDGKSTRDYQAIIEDIGRYIYGRNDEL